MESHYFIELVYTALETNRQLEPKNGGYGHTRVNSKNTFFSHRRGKRTSSPQTQPQNTSHTTLGQRNHVYWIVSRKASQRNKQNKNIEQSPLFPKKQVTLLKDNKITKTRDGSEIFGISNKTHIPKNTL